MYDYLIVGAGLAGSMLGYLLQKEGYKVIILEKQILSNKKKLCAGIITPKTYSLLISEFPKQDIDNIIKTQFCECDIVDKTKITLKDIDIKIVDRKQLDDYILEQYLKLGGKVVEKCKIDNIDFRNSIITSNIKQYRFKYLIGADGTLSCVRKAISGKIQSKNFALESFQTTTEQLRLTVEFVDKYKGYNWIIPMKEVVCIGTGNISQEIKIGGIFDDLANRYKLDNSKKGAFLPTGNSILLNKGNTYLLGDAAGLISPITGEGIYYALYSAQTLFKCFKENKKYSNLMKGEIKKIKFQLILIKIIYNSKIRNWVFKIMRKSNVISKFFHEYVKKLLLS